MGEDGLIRLAVFGGSLVLLAVLEWLWPRRQQLTRRRWRWPNNLGLAAIGTLVVRLTVPAALVVAASWSQAHQFGLLHWIELPQWVALVVTLLALDMLMYWQHVAFHRLPWLWRLHQVHHIDTELDVTSGVRFHPFELLLSVLYKAMVVVALGAAPWLVVLYEVLLNTAALFNHSNLRLPLALDRVLRLLIVTPDMHRIHHSLRAAETNSNFSVNLSCWDRLFGSYRELPEDGQLGMSIGLPAWREPLDSRIDRLLLLPFKSGAGAWQPRQP